MSYTDVALRISRESGWTPGEVQYYLDALTAAGYADDPVAAVETSTRSELDTLLDQLGGE